MNANSNEVFPAPEDPEVLAMTRAMQRSKRKPFIVAGAFAVSLCAAVAFFAIDGYEASRAELSERGYTEVEVHMASPFEYTFEGKKGATNCSGSFSRTPISSSINEFCFTAKGATR